MWNYLYGWTAVWLSVPILIGIGVGVLSMTPPEPRLAQVCFTLAFVILLSKLTWWVIAERQDDLWQRGLFIALIYGAAAMLWFGGWMLAESRVHREVNAEMLRGKYPLGYALFTGDNQTNFIRKNSESKADFSIDWENCRIAFANASFVDIALKNFHYIPNEIQINNLDVVLKRRLGTVADGLFFNSAGLFVELLDDRNNELVYVVGIRPVNSVPMLRDPDPAVAQFVREHVNKPFMSAINTNSKKHITINDMVIGSGWKLADR